MSRGPYPMLLVLAMSLPGGARALGLGDIRIESALNEPLSAQIDIVGASRGELAALTAGVANSDIFQRYGAERPSFLSSATFKVGADGQGRPVLNVRSAAAFSDPLVRFIVDLHWGKNEVVREYSLLLDPPGYATPHAAPDVQMAAAPATPAEPAGQNLHKVPAGEPRRAVARQAGARTELPSHRTAPPFAVPAAAAAAAAAAVVTPPDSAPAADVDAALKTRVASLEHSLNDMHQQLATENANLRSLEDVVAPPKVASAEPDPLPVIASAHADSVSHAAAGPAQTSNTRNWLAPVALGAGLLLAGFVFLRKRGAFASMSPVQPTLVPVTPVAPAAAILTNAPLSVGAAPRAHAVSAPGSVGPVTSAAQPALPSQLAETAKHPVAEMPERIHADNTTISLDIDIEALESSYRDSLSVDSAATASVAAATSDLDTPVIDAKPLPKPIADTSLNFNLLEPDAEVTAEHVDMPSGLHERPKVGESRIHVADVLRSAIEQDPQRSDLRMKLLETYYSAAATNRRAFIDVVRKLSREPGRLSREEWDKVNLMGREIAAEDILFAGAPKDDDLAA